MKCVSAKILFKMYAFNLSIYLNIYTCIIYTCVEHMSRIINVFNTLKIIRVFSLMGFIDTLCEIRY